jgi:hypothetical protein
MRPSHCFRQPFIRRSCLLCSYSRFTFVEELIRLFIHRENMATALREIRIDDLLGRSLVVFCTFIPLFAFRELQRVLGEEKFRALFLGTGTPPKSGSRHQDLNRLYSPLPYLPSCARASCNGALES